MRRPLLFWRLFETIDVIAGVGLQVLPWSPPKPDQESRPFAAPTALLHRFCKTSAVQEMLGTSARCKQLRGRASLFTVVRLGAMPQRLAYLKVCTAVPVTGRSGPSTLTPRSLRSRSVTRRLYWYCGQIQGCEATSVTHSVQVATSDLSGLPSTPPRGALQRNPSTEIAVHRRNASRPAGISAGGRLLYWCCQHQGPVAKQI